MEKIFKNKYLEEIPVEERSMYFLIKVHGEFTIRSLISVRKRIEEALEKGHLYIVFDLSNTIYMDSSVIGLLINVDRKLKERTGGIHLINPNSRILESVEIFNIKFPIHNSIEQADKKIGWDD